MKNKNFILFFSIYWIFVEVLTYNISPEPNTVFKYSDFEYNRSSYFGYSFILYQKSLIIGAPRTNRSSSIAESGAVYKCLIVLSDSSQKQCKRIEIDSKTNYFTHSKSQWFGESLREGNKDENSITICSLAYITEPSIKEICYDFKLNVNLNIREDGELQYLHKKESNLKCMDSNCQTISYLNINSSEIHGSYLGYSLSMILDKNEKKHYFVISAPRYNSQGMVSVFEEAEKNCSLIKILNGTKKFEYFGYGLLIEDFNNDKYNELVVSAPFFAIGERYDVGAIYIFQIELDLYNNNFTLPSIITPPYSVKSGNQFGTAMTKLGDINQDTFNDIAVSAPFQENGVVYIYHGGKFGLLDKPVQIFKSPDLLNNVNRYPHMFGFSLLGNVDVDNNDFKDLIIGAPNVEYAFLYLTYPKVFVKADFQNFSDNISIGKQEKEFNICILLIINGTTLESNHELTFNISLKSRFLDNRVEFISNNNMRGYIRNYNTTVNSSSTTCERNRMIIETNPNNYKNTFELEMNYEIVQEPFSKNFCKNCVANDYNLKGAVYKKFNVKHECDEWCNPDLKIQIKSSHNLNSTGNNNKFYLEMGKHQTFSINFGITNDKDQAYNPRMTISTNLGIPFANVPKFCQEIESVLQCDLWDKDNFYLRKNYEKIVSAIFNTNNIVEESLTIFAEVFHDSHDFNKNDNSIKVEINYIRFSTVEIVELSHPQVIYLYDEYPDYENVNKKIQLINLGPSILPDVQISVSLPISSPKYKEIYLEGRSQPKNITIIGKYNGNMLERGKPVTEMRTERTNWLDENNDRNIQKYKRSTGAYLLKRQFPLKTTKENILKEILQPNDSIIILCKHNNDSCFKEVMYVPNFKSQQHNAVEVSINFKLNLKNIVKTIEEAGKNYFLYKINVDLKTKSNPKDEFKITKRLAVHDVVIVKKSTSKISFWIYISSFVIGIIIYFLIGYILYKVGFFKRKKYMPSESFNRPYSITDLRNPPPIEQLKLGFGNKFFQEQQI